MSRELFPKTGERRIGVFRGFQEGGLEFHADLVLPYKNVFQSIPMHGQFILVQLETPDEAVLGRITAFSSEGKLSYGAGEDFSIRAMQGDRSVPEDLREQYLRYRVNIRVLGVLRRSPETDSIQFAPSVRRLPHVGSPVAFPCDELLKFIAGAMNKGADIGHYALGEYIYASGAKDAVLPDWAQSIAPEIRVKFTLDGLVSRRTMVFARAGFGKSNLVKLLFSELYKGNPTSPGREKGQMIPVGTIIFDRDGEYFWPDARGRPGLCDVEELGNKLVVFTSRQSPSAFYESFVAGAVKLDIRRMPAGDVIAIGIDQERQEQQNVRKLRGLDAGRWTQLVDLIYRDENLASLTDIGRILRLEEVDSAKAEAIAARSNMTAVVKMLHDPASRLLDLLMQALKAGKLCLVDISQMSGPQALVFTGLILRRIFDRNQVEFTKAHPSSVPVIAVIEEAQSVLGESSAATSPYVSWVKEGRKYDLGAVLVTQQPGSISTEILSQGDNWFVFHMLSAADLQNLKRANAHFSDDLLSALLNEPIPGQGLFWSSTGGMPYPVSLRVLSFEGKYHALDPDYVKPAASTYASLIRVGQETGHEPAGPGAAAGDRIDQEAGEELSVQPDLLTSLRTAAVNIIKTDKKIVPDIFDLSKGVAWGTIKSAIRQIIDKQTGPDIDDADHLAYELVAQAMQEIYGAQDVGWKCEKKQGKTGKMTTYVFVLPTESSVEKDC